VRLVAIVGGAFTVAAVAIALIFGISALGGPDQSPEPALTVPVDVGPSDAPATDEGTGNEVVVEEPGMTEEDRKAAEEARKQAEEERKKLEDEQKRLEKEQEKGGRGED
jgi:hypothetical protein